MKTSPRGITLIKEVEGFRSVPYQDTGGVWTVGYGHAFDPRKEVIQSISREEGERLLKDDLGAAERAVERAVTRSLRPSQFDALVSFTYNLGEDQFRNSTLRSVVNEGRDLDVAAELIRWKYDNGKPYLGLLRRRLMEALLYLEDL